MQNTDSNIDKLIEVARLTRESYKQDEIRATMSTRTLVNTAELLLDFGDIVEAYELSCLTLMSTEDRSVVRGMVQQVWGV